ncbi:MAG: dephospho-CoA kinase [Planctomycetaceae bacterium]|nr:dephospho-CoA kinase [Planctomycetaceae bacterium]
MHKPPIIGLLGGIGSGKSTVARMFAALGAAVIDADYLAHEVLNRPEIVEQLKQMFGSRVANSSGQIDRSKVAKIVFDDKTALDSLNSVVHPEVIAQTEELIGFYRADEQTKAIVLDVPLLVEIGWQDRCDYLVFVECSREKRLERIAKTRKIDENRLKKRENFQISLDKKAQLAHYKVDNNSAESEVAEQVAKIFSSIINSE